MIPIFNVTNKTNDNDSSKLNTTSGYNLTNVTESNNTTTEN